MNSKLTEYGSIPKVEVFNEENDAQPENRRPGFRSSKSALVLLASTALLLTFALVSHPTSSSQHFRVAATNVADSGDEVLPLTCPG
mmetsp:Transcript_4199/g.6145  ORF Transcript_4199/g.6145 Transcript_4199/m.6145 type:complete len:86 (-) Transcript_4199:384-641(-)